MAKRIKTNQELMNRVIKMLPEGIGVEAIESVEVDNLGGVDGFNGYWVYLNDGYISPEMGCHTIHEDTLAELADVVGSIEVWADDPDLIEHKGYTTYPKAEAQEDETMFEELTKAFLADIDREQATADFFIITGYFPTWAEEHRNDPDRGIKKYSTELRWEQYKNGQITRDKAIEYAHKRMIKEMDKRRQDLPKFSRQRMPPKSTKFLLISIGFALQLGG